MCIWPNVCWLLAYCYSLFQQLLERRGRIRVSDKIYATQYLLCLTDDENLEYQPLKFN